MDIQRKHELARQHVAIIARHDDADLAVREAALKSVIDYAHAEIENARARLQAKVRQALGQQQDGAT